MIEQRFHIEKYDWAVTVYYAVSSYHTDKIIGRLYEIGCDMEHIMDAYSNLSAGELDTGLCYSNYERRESVIVISRSSSSAEFGNSLVHENGHLACHIGMTCGLDLAGEDVRYLAGDIFMKMFPVAKRFLCDCCREQKSRNY